MKDDATPAAHIIRKAILLLKGTVHDNIVSPQENSLAANLIAIYPDVRRQFLEENEWTFATRVTELSWNVAEEAFHLPLGFIKLIDMGCNKCDLQCGNICHCCSCIEIRLGSIFDERFIYADQSLKYIKYIYDTTNILNWTPLGQEAFATMLAWRSGVQGRGFEDPMIAEQTYRRALGSAMNHDRENKPKSFF